MFKKTRTRLTLLNASVLFIILVLLGSSMYIYLHTQIMNRVDEALWNRARIYDGSFAVQASRVGSALTELRITPRTNPIVEIFDARPSMPAATLLEQYPEDIVEQLSQSKHYTDPYTIRGENGIYRVLNVEPKNNYIIWQSTAYFDESGDYIQLVTNMSAEINMLNTVLGLIIIGIVAGAGISVAAGMYLAQRALVPIRVSWEKQQQFVADASHELRTPLAVLQTHTELLLRHPDHTIEQDSREISTILKEISRMKKLVNGLLTLSESDADKMELQMKPILVDQLIEQALQKFTPLAALKMIELTRQLEGNITILADEERLQQLFMILLDNAIKYTNENGRIELSCKKTSNAVSIQVRDNGIGIPPEELPYIFERFYRGDKVRNRTEGGTGLGLAIARWIITRHNGKIDADSEWNHGTTITISLPKQPSS